MRNFLPTLLEFFALRETDDEDEPKAGYANPFDKPAPLKAPKSNPAGSMMSTKPKMTGPGQRSAPKPVDPGTAFLQKHGYMKPGGSKLSQDYEPPKPPAKPQYKGSYIGQVFQTKKPFAAKPVAWDVRGPNKQPVINPQTGQPQRGFGRVMTQQPDVAVWDGKDWVSSAEFDSKFPGKKK